MNEGDGRQRDKVREYMVQLLARKDDRKPLRDDEALLEGGRIDSADVLDLVAFVEEQFGVDFAARGFDQGDFNSVDEIVAMLGR